MSLHLFRRAEASEIFGGRRDKDSGQRRTNREKEVEEVVSVSLEDDRLNKNICTLQLDRRFCRGKAVEESTTWVKYNRDRVAH